jgi:methylmalonyl-CoA mutase cobalamin-binding subunit
MYTIGEAARRAGVSVELLRAWERRYGVVNPSRTESGYRLYDDLALTRLRTMRRLVDSGWTPRNAASAVLAGTVDSTAAGVATADPATVDGSPGTDAGSDLIAEFVEAAASIDPVRVESTLDRMFAVGSFEVVAETMLLPSLRAVGQAWADERLNVAAEHAASHAVQRRLVAAYQAGGRPRPPDGSILVGLPPGARHELGALAWAVAARRAGLPVLYVGADLPVDDWVRAANDLSARAAVVGVPTDEDAAAASEVGRAMTIAAPDTLVAFGGHGAAGTTLPRVTSPRHAPIVLPPGLVDSVEAVGRALAS